MIKECGLTIEEIRLYGGEGSPRRKVENIKKEAETEVENVKKEDSLFVCEVCGKSNFSSKWNFWQHMKAVHPLKYIKIRTNPTHGEESYSPCPICKFYYKV